MSDQVRSIRFGRMGAHRPARLIEGQERMTGMNLDDDAVPRLQRLMAAEMVKVRAALGKAMADFMASPPGQYLKAVVDYYDRHPEKLDAMIAAREVQARRRDCHCLCQRWGHLGACTGLATTERVFTAAELGATTVPLCAACAENIDAQRTLTR